MARLQYQARAEPLEPTLITSWELDWFQQTGEPVLPPISPMPPSLAFVWEPSAPGLIFPIDLKVYADPIDPIVKVRERAYRAVVEIAAEHGRTGPQHAAVLWWQAWLDGLFLPALEPLRRKPARPSEKSLGELRRAIQRTQWQIDKLGDRSEDVEERLAALANAIIDIIGRLES